MKLGVDDLSSKENIPLDLNEKNIAIRIRGEDINFIVTSYELSVYINEDIADKIAFQLQFILQDRHYRRNPPIDKIS